MTRGGWILALFFLAAVPVAAHEIISTSLTYNRDISGILAVRCLSCHGAAAPVPLANYEQVRPWAVAIKEQVLARSMPPWGAVKGFGDLAAEQALSPEEIALVAAWVLGGAPRGDGVPVSPSAPAPAPVLRETAALTVDTRARLTRPLTATSIQVVGGGPLIESARIVATLPGGRTEPLLWLYRYRLSWRTVFRFRRPLRLPAGTLIEAGAPLRFRLGAR